MNTFFGFALNGNFIDVFEVSLLSNSAIDAIQTGDPITLATAHFKPTADLSMGNSSLSTGGRLTR